MSIKTGATKKECPYCNINFYTQCKGCGYSLKKTKGKALGQKIIEFDNQEDNSVLAFNLLFDEYLGDDPSLEVRILEPYTHNGRILKIGDRKKVQHLFNDEPSHCHDGNYFDVYNKKTGEFIKRYKSCDTIARDYDVTSGFINCIVREKNSNLNIIVKKVKLDK